VNSLILRKLWSTIEQIQSHTLLGLKDRDLPGQIVQEFEKNNPLSPEEYNFAMVYLESRIPLIRDLAESRR
jgi:hypothetical protein